jgi:AraC family transcriptional regulator
VGMPQQAVTGSHVIDAGSASAPQSDAPRSRIGLRVDCHTNLPGLIEIELASDHRLIVHVGAQTRGFWRFHDVLYTGGEIDLLPAGLCEEWEQRDASTVLDVRFSPVLLHRAAEDIGLNPNRTGLEPRCQFRDAQVEHIAWALDAERRTGYSSGLLYTESLGMALAVRLLGAHSAPVTLGHGLTKRQLRRVKAYIEDHLDQDLSLARLASVADVSASHLKTLFRRSTGVPVHQYVIQRRVDRAKLLLMEGEFSISQVALEAGFAHQSHMARWMRRILGVKPTDVRR